MVRTNCTGWYESTGIPHPRGDGPAGKRGAAVVVLYSPPAWGWSSCRRRAGRAGQVFPTRVGMVRRHGMALWLPFCIPHPRGDGPTILRRSDTRSVYSPPAWGWSAIWRGYSVGHFVFPTRVGMVREPALLRSILFCIPHPRGDGPADLAERVLAGEYSPPAWGWSVL